MKSEFKPRMLNALLAVAGIYVLLLLRPTMFGDRFVDAQVGAELTPGVLLRVHYHERIPYYMLIDGEVGGLIGDPVRRALERSGLVHRWEATPPQRQLLLLRGADGYHAGLGWFMTTGRMQFAAFSEPIYQDRPNVALARREDDRLASGRSVSEALAHPELRLLLKKSYTYGPLLDAAIAQAKPRSEMTSGDNLAMLRMIGAGRADYLFLGGEEARALLDQADPGRRRFKLVQFTDVPPGGVRHVMFNRSVPPDWINRFNGALDLASSPNRTDPGHQER
ncbi:MAG TPA: hypothetical protein DCY13_23090 [Verrucomicrobiales bacterium]|nr:hypothetical protein [Verrucomicrobiales bacterium]